MDKFKTELQYKTNIGFSNRYLNLRPYFIHFQRRLLPYSKEWRDNSFSHKCLRNVNYCLDNLFCDFTLIHRYSIDPDKGKIFFRTQQDLLAFKLAMDENWFTIEKG